MSGYNVGSENFGSSLLAWRRSPVAAKDTDPATRLAATLVDRIGDLLVKEAFGGSSSYFRIGNIVNQAGNGVLTHWHSIHAPGLPDELLHNLRDRIETAEHDLGFEVSHAQLLLTGAHRELGQEIDRRRVRDPSLWPGLYPAVLPSTLFEGGVPLPRELAEKIEARRGPDVTLVL